MKRYILLCIGVQVFISCSLDDNKDFPSSSSAGGDIENNIENYGTVKIGEQIWITENLNYNVEGSKCYDNDPANCEKYGRLYTWAMAMAMPEKCNRTLVAEDRNCRIKIPHQGICPKGYHIPSDNDWKELFYYVGYDNAYGFYEPVEGRKLKATSGWEDVAGDWYGDWDDGNGTDDYGFSALPGGYYGTAGFGFIGYEGKWRCVDEGENSNSACSISLTNKSQTVSRGTMYKYYYSSVRCVKD